MCFKCTKCKKTSLPKEKQYLVPIKKRLKTYPVFNRKGKQVGFSEGWETAAEAALCFGCYQIWEKGQGQEK